VNEPATEEVQEVAVPAVNEPVAEEVQEIAVPAVNEPATEEVQEVAVPAVNEPVAEEVQETVAETPEIEETTEQFEDSVKVQDDEELISGEPSENSLQKIEKAKAYLAGILEKMGVKAELEVNAGAESALIEIVTPNSGAIIGKRGETLDALQYLTFMIANRGDKEYYRVILNSANYREKRRKVLEELAHKIAKKVLRSGHSTTLEPMNPYERRIIHSAIAEIEGVSSKSIGEEPYRKVVISSVNAKPARRRNNHRGRDGEGRHDNRGDRRRNGHSRYERKRDDNVQPERISMDSMKTSFEKDYKRPEADDEINAGLYGKIEF
jgi:spoIIIJ-associated protein